jgi:hypothetical protein
VLPGWGVGYTIREGRIQSAKSPRGPLQRFSAISGGLEGDAPAYGRSGQRRELWYTRGISIVVPANSIGNDVGRFRDYEFARSGDAARRPELRILGKEMLDAIQDVQGHALCGGRVMFGDVCAQGNEVVDRFGRPYERHTR